MYSLVAYYDNVTSIGGSVFYDIQDGQYHFDDSHDNEESLVLVGPPQFPEVPFTLT